MNDRSMLRRGTARVLPAILVVLIGATAVQVGLAGASAFGASAWGMHTMLGGLIALLATISLVACVAAGMGREVIAASTITLVLVVLQPVLAVMAQRTSPWFGLLHAADALLLFTLLAWAAWTTFGRRRSDHLATVQAA